MKSAKKTIRTKDGTILELKEASVLDSEGNTIVDPSYPFYEQSYEKNRKIRVFKLSPWMAPLVVVAVGAMIVIGAAFVGGLFILLMILFIFRIIFSKLLR